MAVEIPATCIPDLNVSFDANRDWPCKRAAFVFSLNALAREIEQVEGAMAQAKSDRGRRNLAKWVEDAESRLSRLVVLADEKPCTCKESGLYG